MELRALGTTATVAVTRGAAREIARALLRVELDAVDRACSRFRPDSEVWTLAAASGTPVRVSELLFEALAVACRAAHHTGGAVDPTVGAAVVALGYDRDFASVARTGPALDSPARPAPGWWQVALDPATRTVRVPAGVLLDLGATAKALAADRAAGVIAGEIGGGVLVGLGGDVAVAGDAPGEGWAVGIATDAATPRTAATRTVAVRHGGVASSSTAVRAWRRGDRTIHHIVDPRTGEAAGAHWRLVSVAAASCVDANAASTAAIVWGPSAVERLEALHLPSRLVRHDGAVVTVAGWPAEPGPASPLRCSTPGDHVPT